MVTLTLGAVTVNPIAEIEYCTVDVSFLFNVLTTEDMQRNLDWLDDEVVDIVNEKLGFSFRAYLVKIAGLNVLVDACNGNHKNRPTARWQHELDSSGFLDSLKAAGVAPEDINIVVCTHLHCDHVGWLTQLSEDRWVPTFANARHIFSGKEFDHYHERMRTQGSAAANHGAFEDSVLPVTESCRFELVQNDMVIVDSPQGTVRLVPSAGHSIDHVSVSIQSQGQEAIVCGDVVHHPIQLDMPLLPMRSDFDPALAAQSRQDLLNHCADSGAWLLAGHFCKYPFVSIRRHNGVFRIKNAASAGEKNGVD